MSPKNSKLPQAVVPFAGGWEQSTRDEALERIRAAVDELPFVRGRLITGERDDNAPTGLTEGISFVSGTAKVIEHGLGQTCVAWFEVSMADQTTRPALVPAHDDTIDLEKHIRVTPSNTSKSYIFVMPRSSR